MEHENLQTIAAAAAKKLRFFSNKWKYLLYAMLAGCFCSIGMAFAYSAGTGFYLSPAVSGLYKLAIGICFALSFTLIVFAGSELFTGNVMVMTVGVLNKTTKLAETVFMLIFCYLSNLAGAAFMAWLIASAGLVDGSVGELLIDASAAKMAIPFAQAFFRGVLCNIMVCLGTWMISKIKSETAKMIALVWVVAGFVTPGYEHSIANTGLFTMAALSSIQNPAISMMGAFSNMLPVTLGNIAGGVFVGVIYWASGSLPAKRGVE